MHDKTESVKETKRNFVEVYAVERMEKAELTALYLLHQNGQYLLQDIPSCLTHTNEISV